MATVLTCPSRFVFFRVPLEPRITADQSGVLPGVYATYNAVDPATVVPSTTSYSSAGSNSGLVGRSVVYVIRSTNNGQAWSSPISVDPAGGRGHQYFSDIDALGGKLVAVWQDNRTDDAYSVQLPIGNTLDAQGRPVSSGTDVVGTYAAVSDDGVTFVPTGIISSTTHQPSYEMFSNRQLPFQGDYNYVALALSTGRPRCSATWPGPTTGTFGRASTSGKPTTWTGSTSSSAARPRRSSPISARTRTGSTRTSTASRPPFRPADRRARTQSPTRGGGP